MGPHLVQPRWSFIIIGWGCFIRCGYYTVSLTWQVLQIIPESMFTLLHQIIEILTNRMREVPTRLEKEKMKEFAQLDARYEVRMRYSWLVFLISNPN